MAAKGRSLPTFPPFMIGQDKSIKTGGNQLKVLQWLKKEFLVKACDQQNTVGFEKDIMKKLKNGMNKKGVKLKEKRWTQDIDDGQQPVIVFCVFFSRIGIDIENAMRGVHGNSRVILVLLHPVLSSLLRGDLSDDEQLLEPDMKNRMSGIAHFAFSDREGVYRCYQNTVGHKSLCESAKKVVKTKVKPE